jgi:hypothetical protein
VARQLWGWSFVEFSRWPRRAWHGYTGFELTQSEAGVTLLVLGLVDNAPCDPGFPTRAFLGGIDLRGIVRVEASRKGDIALVRAAKTRPAARCDCDSRDA